ncbi:MAG: substrate-binding domain-containing protein [Oscillospiraceae bacterium]
MSILSGGGSFNKNNILLRFYIDTLFILQNRGIMCLVRKNNKNLKENEFMKTKNILTLALVGIISATALVGCGKPSANAITTISREDGSGTRGAFIELFGIEEKTSSGSKIDHTTKEAVIANKTDVMLTQVSGNASAIGYVSLGSLNESIKALKIDGTEATTENVKNKSYKISRPFEIAAKAETSEVTKDFMNFILSKEGQAVVVDNKYIAVSETAPAFKSSNAEGKIVIAGSSSVTPVMEKLSEAYKKINSKATIEVQQSDSTAGIKSAIDGTADIGMASRELKDSEKEALTPTTIAIDGIAVIVNKENQNDDISSENVKKIFVGEVTNWDEVK